ncbi:MAG: septation protein A [Rickettsia endosymbiont of Glossina mortisans submortisans]|nr:septation protein A [Rickettsia endosymbiont of Glossina mortisans submortisans]
MLKLLSEIGPVLALIIGYFYGGGLQNATLYMIITAIICTTLCYFIEGKVSKLSIISTLVLLVSGSITLISGDSTYIKMKPTILYVIFGIIFLMSGMRKNPFIKYALESIVRLKAESWITLSYRTAAFFFFMAVVNEIVWRNFSDETWVTFKVFGAIPITFIFILLQLPLLLKNKLPDSKI